MQQIFMLAMLVAAALFVGVGSVPVGVYAPLGVGLALMALTPNPYLGVFLQGASGVLLACLACHLGVKLRATPKAMTWFLIALVAAALLNAVEGLLQWLGLVGELYRWVIEPEQRGTAFGAFRQVNLFATFLCVGSVGVVWLVHRRRLTEPMAWLVLGVLMFGVAASGSRTGILEVLALAVLAWHWSRRQHDQVAPAVSRLFAGQLLLLASAMLLLPGIAQLHGFAVTSAAVKIGAVAQDGRFTIWQNAIALICERPWFGWGWREFGYGHYLTVFDHRFPELLDNAHNLPLQIAVEFGLPVAVAVCGGIVTAVVVAKPWQITPAHTVGPDGDASERVFAWAILMLIVGIHSMLEYPLWYAGFLFLTGLCVGYVLPVRAVGAVTGRRRMASVWLARGVALALIGLSLVAWQQYAQLLAIYKIPFTNNVAVRRAAISAALAKAQGAWMFQGQLDAATLGATEVTAKNAPEVRVLAEKLLHYSADAAVIQPLMWSLWYLGDGPDLRFHTERFCRAYPAVFKRWSEVYANHPITRDAGSLNLACQPTQPLTTAVR